MAERLVVVGGDAGGMAAAMQARRARPDLDIVALEKGRFTSYSACGIPYLIGGDVDGHERLIAKTPQQFREARVDARILHEVMGVDLAARTVEVRDHEHDRTYTLGFDVLHVATGATPFRPPLPGIDGPGIYGVQTLDDGLRLWERAKAADAHRVVVVGGGYIGIEIAEAFIQRGARVTVVEAAPQVMVSLDPDMGALVTDAMRGLGMDVRVGVGVDGFDDGVVHTADGDIGADLVVLGLGVRANSRLGKDAGLATGEKDALKVDRRQRTSADGVWAAGDCCESFHLVAQRPVHFALGTIANKQGRVAGVNIGGGTASFPGVVGTAISKVCAYEVARTGLTEAECRRYGFDHDAATIESTNRAGYFPGAVPMKVKLVSEKRTGRLLGGQIVGREGAGKRIDVLATAVTAGMTVQDVVDLDLAYAPPFSPVWDPVQVAARKLAGA